ncbi:MAG TPA: hypothetical protein VIG28_04400, partial [Leifsonia sp.]
AEAQAPAAPAPAAPEPQDDVADVQNPPSEPVSARGHINRPAEPAKTIEPEPVVASHDDVAAAVARSADEPGAVAAGSATADTASPVEAATPVIVAGEAARLQQDQGWRQPEAPVTATDQATAHQAAAQPTAQQQPAAAPAAAYAGTPIYIQRPEPPKKRSNRGFGILIALVGTVVFAALWVLAVFILGYLLTPTSRFAEALYQFFLGETEGWVPVLAFFIGMVVLIQILNRARWWAYILGGLFVAIFVYFAFVGAWIYDTKVLNLNPAEAAAALQRAWLSPFAVLAGVIAREISMWTGAWLAARGRKLKARNAEAQADYEQQLADAQNQAVAAYAQPQGY